MHVGISGASGLIGTALSSYFRSAGDEVRPIGHGGIPPGLLDGVDAVVHLAGEPIARRWTEARKKRIRESRVAGTRRLVEALGRLPRRPAVLVSASAVGYYGPRGEERIAEETEAGRGFLASVCREWEAEAEKAERLGIRTVRTRFGIVLSARGGALAKMLPAFKAGLGGPLGGGRQGFPWIALKDVVRAIDHLVRETEVSGPVNVVGPSPLAQREFARALGRALGRPAVLPVPGAVVRAVFGEMGEEALLSGAFVVPERLLASGFRFAFPDVDRALAHALAD